MRHFIGLLFILIFATVSTTAAPKRVALVIGTDVKFELNPAGGQANDARMFGDALREYGFEVTYGLNTTKERADEVIGVFAKKLSEKDVVGIFFFAGPAFNANGENFILPADADRTTGETIQRSFVSLKPLGDALKNSTQSQKILFLDPNSAGLYVRWKNPNGPRHGLIPFADATESLVLQASSFGGEFVCGKQGALVMVLLNIFRQRGGEIGGIAAAVAKMLDIGGSEILRSTTLSDNRKRRLVLPTLPSAVKSRRQVDLSTIYEQFKTEAKCQCGLRLAAKLSGEELLSQFRGDKRNVEVLKYVENKLDEISKRETRCRLERAYNSGHAQRDWWRFMAAADALLELLDEDGLKLDINLDAASMAYDRIVLDLNTKFGPIAVKYSRQALLLLDKKIVTQTKKWGVFFPFQSRKASRFWMHRIIGIELLATEPAQALEHLGKAVRIFGPTTRSPHPCAKAGSDCTDAQKRTFAYMDASGQVGETQMVGIYRAVGDYYFREALALSARYYELSETPENATVRVALAESSKKAAELSLDAFGRAGVFYRRGADDRLFLLAVAGFFNLVIPEMGDVGFTGPSAETLAERPIPLWKVLQVSK